MVALQIVSLLLFNMAPFFGLVFGGGWIRALAGISVVIALCFHLGGDAVMRVSPLYCLTLHWERRCLRTFCCVRR